MPDAPAEETRRPVDIPPPRLEAPYPATAGESEPTDLSEPPEPAAMSELAEAALAAGTVHEGLAEVAARRPAVSVTFPSVKRTVTLPDLVAGASSLAASLAAIGVRPQDNVGILSENSPDFLLALVGVNQAGAVACPLQLPASARDLAGHAARLGRAIAVAGIQVVLVGTRTARLADRFAPALGGVRLVTVGDLTSPDRTSPDRTSADHATPGDQLPGATGHLPSPKVGPDDLALVQFTSGSTAAPKGVRLTHRNILAGLAAIIDGVALDVEDHGGIWLPLFHDMGLFGTLSGIFAGMSMTVWSPADFVKDPAGWLRYFVAQGGTILPMPNFGYDYLSAAFSPAEASALDLRGWRVAFNGAEPITPESVARFRDTFAAAGLSPTAMLPVYGMAEATLAVTFPPLGREPVHLWVDRDRLAREGVAHDVDPSAGVGTQTGVDDPADRADARGLVGVGRPVRGMQVRIGERGGPGVLGDNHVGEIQIRGAAVTGGYLTAEPVAAAAAPFTADGWLRTGDLGFLRDGELFVTGRDKEMIIVRGVNHYPQDAEGAAQEVEGVYRRRCVACAEPSPGGTETMAIIAETQITGAAELATLAADIRAAVSEALGLTEVVVHLVAPNSLPRTSSGKFQRLAARAACSPLPLAAAGAAAGTTA